MNKHIELVEKWLKDSTSVSLDELTANKDAAYDAAAVAADAANDAADAYAVAADAADTAADAYAVAADYYVKRYKELTKEDV